jgi:hypothetical protein
VHCAGGVSRSATVVLGYLMARHGLSFDQSLTHLRRVRPWVNPNAGFVLQLQEWERLGRGHSNWRPWREAWAAAVSSGGAASGAGDGCRQAVLSIPPPVDAAAGASALLGFSRLRVGGSGGGGAARRGSQEQPLRRQQQQPP